MHWIRCPNAKLTRKQSKDFEHLNPVKLEEIVKAGNLIYSHAKEKSMRFIKLLVEDIGHIVGLFNSGNNEKSLIETDQRVYFISSFDTMV